MKKYLNIAFWLFIGIYLFVVLGFVSSRQKKTLCTSIHVIYVDSLEHHFVDKDDLIKLIDEKDEKVLGRPISELNLSKLEDIISAQAYVKSAEVYTEINGILNAEIAQRMPIIRIINNENQGFYIDDEGYLLPLSKKVSLRLLVASGNINFSPDFDTTAYIYDNANNDINKKVLQDLLTLADYINSNEFWKAQIQQIYVNKKNEFELVPLVGAQIIYFGNINNYQKKFKKLEATYKKGFLYKGWNQYKSINLKYENQVVCEKK
jgi:cell division protein FtsQ